MSTFKKDASFVESLQVIARSLIIIIALFPISYWLFHLTIVSCLIGTAAGVITMLLISMLRNWWGDTITLNTHSICIDKNGKQIVEIPYSSINVARVKKDTLSMTWKVKDKNGMLIIGKERFSKSTWMQLMQCMEKNLTLAGVSFNMATVKPV